MRSPGASQERGTAIPMRALRHALSGVFIVGLTACAVDNPSDSAAPSLREVTIPSDFTFQTSRTVSVQINPSDDVFVDTKDAPVEVRRPDGAVLYRGAVRKGKPLDVEVSVPTHVESLDVAVGRDRSVVKLRGAQKSVD